MKAFYRIFLCLCLPVLLLQPMHVYSHELTTFSTAEGKELYVPKDASGMFNPWELYKVENFSYERIFEFAQLLEEDAFWESLSIQELETLVDYLIWALRMGLPKSHTDLQEKAELEIERLLSIVNDAKNEALFSLNQNFNFEVLPAICYGHPYFVQCGLLGQKWKEVKKWAKDNKGAIIVCAVVITAIVIGAVTGGVGASSAVAVGGALAGGAMDNTSPPSDHINKPGEVMIQGEFPNPPLPPSMPPASVTYPVIFNLPSQASSLPHVKEIYDDLEEKTEVIKEDLLSTILEQESTISDKPFWENVLEKTRDTASYLAHETFDDLAKVGEMICDLSLNRNETKENYQALIDSGHEVIDNIFHTDQAYLFDSEFKEEIQALNEKLGLDMTVGWLPPPGTAASTSGAARAAASVEVEGVSVYRAINEATGEIEYVGITNNFSRRAAEHLNTKGIKIDPIPGLSDLSRVDARAVE
jgi:hypothetical protein